VCRVTSPRLLRCIAGSALSEPTPAKPAERAPSRGLVVVPTERRRPLRRCADRAVDTRTRTRRVVRCRASNDITAPHSALLFASPARLSQSRHRRRRASAEPRAGRRADRAPPTSSCMRRSYCRRTCAPPRAPPCAGDIPAPHPVLLVALPARLSQSRHRRRRASAEPRAGHRADRAPPTSSYVRRSSRCQPRVPCRLRCSVPTVVTASGFCCFSAHHRSKLVASAGSEQAPHRERAAVPVVRQPC